jgi:hypothetical protein
MSATCQSGSFLGSASLYFFVIVKPMFITPPFFLGFGFNFTQRLVKLF